MQRGYAARDYSMQCDRPSHLLRSMKGRGCCHSAPAKSHRAQFTCPACYCLKNQAAYMSHNVWLFYKSNSCSKQKKQETGLRIDGQMCFWVEFSAAHSPNSLRPWEVDSLYRQEKLRGKNNSNSIMSCSNISSKCVRNLRRLGAWCGCQLGCKQPGLVL